MNINVTQPFLPPKAEYLKLIDSIWERNWLTNHGPLVNELETRLKARLGLTNLLFVSNGTIALQLAIKALGLKGDIITTPFSYVATTSSIVWENCRPVMTDISASSLNIDPKKIEAAITDQTSAILATHVYGNACEIDEIAAIAKKHNLKVIYDAAHGFGTTYMGKSIFSYGDVATASFHATKLFHTIEGGAVTCADKGVLTKLSMMRNFGHNSASSFGDVGINGKNSEFHAAMGLCNLEYVDAILSNRREISLLYDEKLRDLPITKPRITDNSVFNYAYYPIILESEERVLALIDAMNLNSIFPRRYFYPSLSELPYLDTKFDTPVSDDISRRVLCLPLYYALTEAEVDLVCTIIRKVLGD